MQIKKMVEDAMLKHGLKSASAKARMKEKLYEEMEEAFDEQVATGALNDRRVDPTSLLGKRRGKADKAERMASVLAGREDREEFGSSVARKKRKKGGLSNVQKQKQKVVPLGAHKQQAANRKRRQKQKNNPKHQRGRASRGAWD
jgi:SDA1